MPPPVNVPPRGGSTFRVSYPSGQTRLPSYSPDVVGAGAFPFNAAARFASAPPTFIPSPHAIKTIVDGTTHRHTSRIHIIARSPPSPDQGVESCRMWQVPHSTIMGWT